ncbi:MAG: hypothetical protein DCC65_13785 [Planctomycetota bacterium]|nr:MAG: hypothetical protein DCC65_13785 [Planctomycetota bacterium]
MALIFAGADRAAAQTQRRTNAALPRDLLRAPGFRGVAGAPRNRMGTFQSGERTGFTTRRDQMKAILAATSASRYAAYQASKRQRPTNPIDQVLKSRNLLGVQSPLARKTLNHDPYSKVLDEELPMFLPPETAADDASPPISEAAPAQRSTSDFLDELSGGLSSKGDEYYEVGMAYFRNGDFVRAKNYFELDREIHRQHVRPYIADVLTASEIRRAQRLEELAVDRESFFPDPVKFDRTLSLMNVMVNQAPDQPATHALLAYYSWLNGDTATARSSAERAASIATASEVFDAQTDQILLKFTRLLSGKEEPLAASPSAATGR